MTRYLTSKHNVIMRCIIVIFFSAVLSLHAREEFAITPISYPNISKNYQEIMLGKALFNDTILFDNGKSCSGCHIYLHGGAYPSSLGAPNQATKINVPTVFNTGLNFRWHWDGRFRSLADHLNQIIMTEADKQENAWENLVDRLLDHQEYKKVFLQIYGDVTKENIINSITEYEKALIAPSLFDKHLKGTKKLPESALRGFHKFQSYGCISCHQGKNIGGNLIVPIGIINDFSENKDTLNYIDYGHYNVTGKERHKFYFRVPSLRNVARTSPYFHDGSVDTLERAVSLMAFYQLGLELEKRDVMDIVSFLESLSGDPLPELME